MTSTELLKFFIAMMVITNPLAAIPIFVGLTANLSVAAQRKTAVHAGLATLVILLIVTWIGLPLLHFFGIDIGAFKVAGGLIILLMGLSMLHSKTSAIQHTEPEQAHHLKKQESVAVVPLAIPLMAGPGAISTIIVWTEQYHTHMQHMIISGVNIGVAFVLGFALFFAGNIGKCLGPSGIRVVVRIMGMILAAIAIEMIASGLQHLFPALHG